MKKVKELLTLIMSLLSIGVIGWCFPWPISALAFLPVTVIAATLLKPQRSNVVNAQMIGLSDFRWDPDTFCRGWLITGSTGSGKTASGLMRIAHLLFTHFPNWGGLIIDPKCVLWIAFKEIAAHYGREDDFINLAVRKPSDPKGWQPPHRYNIVSYPGMTWKTKAKIIVDTATSLQGAGDKGFFKTQAQIHIGAGLESLELAGFTPRLSHLYRMLTSERELRVVLEKLHERIVMDALSWLERNDQKLYQEVLEDVAELRRTFFHSQRNQLIAEYQNSHPDASMAQARQWLTKEHPHLDIRTLSEPVHAVDVGFLLGFPALMTLLPKRAHPKAYQLAQHWEEKYLIPAADQIEGVKGTISNYLEYFSSPEMEEVFSSDQPNTVEFEEIDRGKFICISMPQLFQAERDYVFTFFKLMYYQHALNRFDYKSDQNRWSLRNLLVFIGDEAQGVVTAAEDGMADYNVVDKIREALATIVFATQSPRSFLPRLKTEAKLEVLLLNLKNHMIGQASDTKGAKNLADVIGSRMVWKKSYSSGNRSQTVSSSEQEKHWWSHHELQAFKKFEMIIKHPELGHRKVKLPPLDQSGRVSEKYLKLFVEDS